MNESLLNIVIHAYSTVPAYKALADEYSIDLSTIRTLEDFERLPLITKEMIQGNTSGFLSEAYNYFPLNERLVIQRTSGSTGQYLKTYWHKDDMTRSLLELWLIRLKRYGIRPEDPYCYFYTTDYIANRLVNEEDRVLHPLKRSKGFSKNALTRDKLRAICEEINEFQPKWMMLQPSMAQLLASTYSSCGMPIPDSLQYIELSGEFLFDNVREDIARSFGCAVGNQYGCNEANSIAADCGENVFHCMNSNVYIEVLEDGKPVDCGVEGDIYITSLTNFAMPFIRYKIGDRGFLLGTKKCVCGEEGSLLQLTAGRTSDYAILEDGFRVPSYAFLRPIEHINEKVGNIVQQFRVSQIDTNEFVAKFCLKPAYSGWSETVSSLFIKYIKQPEIASANWRFEFVDELFVPAKGEKMAYFANECI